jgi:hypothetical protein
MKNVHRMYDMRNIQDIKENIYITSDEYIGLSYYLDGNLVRKGVVDDKDYWEVRKDYKKIILTTDQDLIKDGVQAIDDEFLEWFVKNPSCEEVEVEMNQGRYYDYGGNVHITNAYKIIIPKEELDYTALLQPVGTKQETLEDYDIKDNKIMLLEEDLECVNMYLDDLKLPRTDDKGNEYSIVGRIKILQQEQDKKMYSEGEMLEVLHKFGFDYTYNYKGEKTIYEWIPEWFEEYKRLEQLNK